MVFNKFSTVGHYRIMLYVAKQNPTALNCFPEKLLVFSMFKKYIYVVLLVIQINFVVSVQMNSFVKFYKKFLFYLFEGGSSAPSPLTEP